MDAPKQVLDSVPAKKKANNSWAVLYVHLLHTNGEARTNAQLMRDCGIKDHRTFRAAKEELYARGYVNRASGQVQNVGMITTILTEVGMITTPLGMITRPDVDTWEALQARMVAVDALPSDGEKTQYGSNFQVRRRAQISVLQAAWRTLFPGNVDMTIAAAKRLLCVAEDSGLEVFEEADRVQSLCITGDTVIQSPRAYLEATLYNHHHPDKPRPKRPRKAAPPPPDDSVPF